MSWEAYAKIAIGLAIFIVPMVLGGMLSRRLRMPDHGWKITLCLFTLFAGLGLLFGTQRPRLGIDLSGGVILVYEVDQQKKKDQGIESVDMGELISAVSRRVNPGGQKEVTIRQFGAEQIEIIIPDATDDELAEIKMRLGQQGSLEFLILANTNDHEALIELARVEKGDVVREPGSKNRIVARWVPIAQEREAEFANDTAMIKRTKSVGKKTVTQVLMVVDEQKVTGAYLTRASAAHDMQTAEPEVEFNFNAIGGALFGELTTANAPDPVTGFKRRLGIVLDNYLQSAPQLNSPIHESGRITGRFTEVEVKALANVLNAGKLPAALTKEPISEMRSGATLGQDTIQRSRNALLAAAIAVPAFMLWYYRFAGIVANIALLFNMILLIGIMVAIKAAFTLPGLAGLALTMGMAVDNNVLIYERLREELGHGAAMRMAIRNAFQRASATIIDANLTTLIAATVLYVIGTDQVKGFAVALWLGVAISMFTSVFVARVVFDIADKRQWGVLARLNMRHLIRDTKIDFMGMFPYCAAVSVTIIILSIALSFVRGKGLFDIDFTGGVSVQAVFEKPQDINRLRDALEDLPDVAVTNVALLNEESGLRFLVNTSEGDMKTVEGVLKKAFPGELLTNAMTIAKAEPIVAAAKPETTPDAKSESKAQAQPDAKPAALATPEKKDDAKAKEPAKQPASDKQSRRDLPGADVLAYSDEVAMLLAAEEKKASDTPKADAKKPEAKPEAKPKAAEKPVEKPAQKPAAKPADKPLEKPAEKPPAKPEAAQEPAPKLDAMKVEPGTGTTAAATAAPATVDPFVGGTQLELQFAVGIGHARLEEMILNRLGASASTVSVEIFNDAYQPGQSTSYKSWSVKVQLPPEKARPLFDGIVKQTASEPYFPSSNTIGGAVASDTTWKAVSALVASWVCMIIYLWVRFQGVAFGLAAVIALIHDCFVMLGALALSSYVAPYLGFLLIEPFKINLPIIAAFLTIIGFSVNDTIVVFDRIREVRGKDPNLTAAVINLSVNQTLSRTILTSLTVLLVTAVLYCFGGQALRGFMFALLAGVVTGTYSSVYVAAPILLVLVGKKKTA